MMGFQVPTDLIRQVQISLRNDAGLSSYDPQDPTLPSLPSHRELVAGFDPSPPYLRCKQCKGRLVRGIQSAICVYCGDHQTKDVTPDPIAFKSTFGYQWLLQSLDLDGSETIGPPIEENKFSRVHSIPREENSLSDLLNIKITWPAESEKPEHSLVNSVPTQSKNFLNLVGVDLDNFFTESKRDVFPNSAEEQPVINKQGENVEMNAFARKENVSLFQNVQHSEVPVRSSEVEDDGAFSGWEADFQSADSGNQHEGSRSFDPFVGSAVDVSAKSAHMDSLFGPGKVSEDEKTKDVSTPSASASTDWMQDDLWINSNLSSSHQAEQVDAAIKNKDVTIDNVHNHLSSNIDWFPDDQWQTSSITAPDNKKISEDNDSFDVWNAFSSSTSAKDTSKNLLTQSDNQIATVDKQTSDIFFSSSTNDFQDMDFGSFSQPGPLSGSFNNQKGSVEVNNMQSEGPAPAPALDRMADLEVGGNSEQAAKEGDIFNLTTNAKDSPEDLLSQVPDLSFMLKTDLSIPPKSDD